MNSLLRFCLALLFISNSVVAYGIEISQKTIVADKKANAIIILMPDAPDSVKFAANEFQNYINQVTNVIIPIQNQPGTDKTVINIFIGQSEYTKQLGINIDNLKTDGFRIVAKDNWLVIAGRDYAGAPIYGAVNPWQYNEVYSPKLKIGAFGETGTLYGVYEFLYQNCGIRWYMPGPIGTVVSLKDKLEISDLDITKSPDYEYRYPWLCNFSETDDEPLWFRRAGFGAAAPIQINHSFVKMLKYKDSHPEFFALIDGKRDFTNLSTAFPDGNLCLSNRGLHKQWVEDICKYFDEHPEQQLYSVAPNDGMLRICDCNECQAQIDLQAGEKGKFSNYVWTFLDKVAQEVAKKYPNKYIGCFAYENYKVPPTCIEKLSPNVAVMICKSRASYYDKAKWEKDNLQIKEWRKKASVLYIWEYYLQSWLPWRDLPIPFPHIISDDLKGLKGLSRGEFIEAESWESDGLPNKMNFPGMQHLNLYVTARMYWDTSLNVDNLLEEYFKLFYGSAEKEMKSFWLTAEKYWMNQGKNEKVIGFGGGDPMKIYTKEHVETLAGFLNSAKSKTLPDSIYRKRIDIISGEFERSVK
jgi:hypothetical protein